MIVYPAVDIMGGRCVRLYQGRAERAKVYSEDPAAMARRWQDEGAEFLHVVDLDGALAGRPSNLEAVQRVVETVGIPVQLGGGIRSLEALESAFALGLERIVLGTTAVTDPGFVSEASSRYPGRVAAGLDARGGVVTIAGWTENTGLEVEAVVRRLEELGVARIIFTNVSLDGTRRGVDADAVRRVAAATDLPIIASGGVAVLNDIEKLKPLEVLGVDGVIVGTALYEGAFSLSEAIEVARG